MALVELNWQAVPERARLFLIPAAPVASPLSPLRLGSSVIGYAAARLVAYADGARALDHLVSADDLNAVIASAPPLFREDLEQAHARLMAPRAALQGAVKAGADPLPFTKPRIMGVVNVTPDSFSDGGQFIDAERAIAHGRALAAAGADIIDIGGESTRPGAQPVWEGEEADRVVPVITALASEGYRISIDSRHASVQQAALDAGAAIINDVSALTYDPGSIEVAVNTEAPVILMHAQGEPKTMQNQPRYDDVLLDVYLSLEASLAKAEAAGIKRERLMIDPGLGFGKRVVQDNIALLDGLDLFHTLGVPLLVGASRKRFIGAITGVEEANQRLAGSLAVAVDAVRRGAQVVRVHDVAETEQALAITQAILDGAAMGAMAGDR